MVHIVHHVDLDGYGVKVLGMLYAEEHNLPYKTYECGYAKVNPTIQRILNANMPPEEILIGDLSVNEEVGKRLNQFYCNGMKLKLWDHHVGAEFLNQYDWAVVKNDIDGIAHCGTWLMFQDNTFDKYRQNLQVLIDTIDDYDTWNWKTKHNHYATDLQSIFTIYTSDEFTQYLYDLIKSNQPINTPEDLFTDKMRHMIETQKRLIEKQADSACYYMHYMNLWVNPDVDIDVSTVNEGLVYTTKNSNKVATIRFITGIIYTTTNLSEVADLVLDKHPEIDILMVMVPPGCISWRTRKDLPVPLGDIARWATGKGGGHNHAASSMIAIPQTHEWIFDFADKNFNQHLQISGLRKTL